MLENFSNRLLNFHWPQSLHIRLTCDNCFVVQDDIALVIGLLVIMLLTVSCVVLKVFIKVILL